MKAFVLLLSLAAAPLVSNAQTSAPPAAAAADPPGLQVVKSSWSKERIDWSQNPFGGPIENFHEMQFRARAEKRAKDMRGNPAEQGKAEADARVAAAIVRAEHERKNGPPRYAFLYKAAVRNGGAKAIKEIDWDYAFFDAATGAEVGRQEFTSEEKIEPGRKKELSFLVPSPPAHTISVYSLNQKESASLTGRVVLVRILYADGTVWQRQ